MFRRRKILLLLFSLTAAFSAQAQVGQSPYTIRGIGNINNMATARNIGMGGIGIGNTHPLFISVQNPALLSNNAYYTTAIAGLSLESRSLATTQQQDRIGSGGFDYLSVAFPIIKYKMALNIGLAPYSTVSYNLLTTEPVQGLPNSVASVLYQGSGGLTQAYAATGISIFKGFSVGVRASYLFGNITERVATSFSDSVTAPMYGALFTERTSFSDMVFTGALAYRKDFNKERGTFMMAGLTYELETNLDADRFFSRERSGRVFGNVQVPPSLDTLANHEASLRLPAAIGFGVSYGRAYRYAIGADLKLQNWEEYRSFESNQEEGLGNSYRLSIGGEVTPNYISRTYFSRITYRTGVQVEKTPFKINGESINEFGINFGLTFPVGASGVHTGFTLGQRGEADNGLIRERFFRFSLGVTLNERWFERYKYD